MTDSIAEYQDMVEKNHNLIWAFLHKYHLSDDYYGDAAVGLCKAVLSYDADRGVSFSTFAYKCMYNECAMTMRQERCHNPVQTVSLDAFISEECNSDFSELLSDGNITGEQAESAQHALWLIEDLSTTDLEVVLYRLHGLSFKEISTRVGMKPHNIQVRLGNIKKSYSQGQKPRTRHRADTGKDREGIQRMILQSLCSY